MANRDHYPVEREVVFRGHIVEVGVDRLVLPNGEPCELEVIHHPGGAASVAIDARGDVCLLRQFRHAVGGWLWELPAGCLDPGESPGTTARRELLEEAGVVAETWQSLGEMVSSPGVFTERVHLYLATDLAAGPASPAADEVIELHWLPFGQALVMARDGEISDAKTVIGLLRAQARTPTPRAASRNTRARTAC